MGVCVIVHCDLQSEKYRIFIHFYFPNYFSWLNNFTLKNTIQLTDDENLCKECGAGTIPAVMLEQPLTFLGSDSRALTHCSYSIRCTGADVLLTDGEARHTGTKRPGPENKKQTIRNYYYLFSLELKVIIFYKYILYISLVLTTS